MAENILDELMSNYKKTFETRMKELQHGHSLNKDGYISMKGGDEESKAIRSSKNDLLKAYVEEDKLLKGIQDKRRQFEQEIFAIKIKNNDYSKKEEEKLQRYRLNAYKEEISFLTKDKYNKIHEQEADIHKQILEQNGIASDEQLQRLYELKEKEIELNESSLDAQMRQYEQHVKEQQQKDENRVNNLKSGIKNVIKHTVDFFNKQWDMMTWNNLKKSISDLNTQYEANFTEIAGRTGANSQLEAHNLIANTALTVANDDVLKTGLNFNNEVFPEITKAVQQGFVGEDAQIIAITNAIDNKIMPWLETTSETWSYLQFTLSDSSLKFIKGQQLLLQNSKEGNRLLNTGVINAINDTLAPVLASIDINTTSKEDIAEFYAIAQAQLGDKAPESLIKETAKQMYNAVYKPYETLTNGSVADKVRVQGYMQTGSVIGMEDYLYNTLGVHMEAAGDDSLRIGAMGSAWGINLPADTQDNVDKYFTTATESNKIVIDSADAISAYTETANDLNDYLTETQKQDNKVQNEQLKSVIGEALKAHGLDKAGMILEEVINIKNWLIASLAVEALGKVVDWGFDKLGNKVTNKVGSKLTGKITGGSGTGSGSTIGNLFTNGAGNNTATQIMNSTASGAILTVGGALVAGAGINAGVNDYQKYHKATTTDEEKAALNSGTNKALIGTAIAGGTVAAGAGIATLVGAGAAAGPIGWAALAIGGIALVGKAAYDHANRLSGLAEQYEAKGEELKATFKQEQRARIQSTAQLKESIRQAEDDEEAKQLIVQSGLLTEKEARDLTATELTSLVQTIYETETAIASLGEAAIDAKTKEAKSEAQAQTNEVLDKTYENILSIMGDDGKLTDDDKEWHSVKGMFEGLASSITDEDERKAMEKQIDTMFSDGVLNKDDLNIMFDRNDVSSWWAATWSGEKDMKNNFYDYAMDVESANAYLGTVAGNGRYDLDDVTLAQETAAISAALDKYYEDWKSATGEAKIALKNSYSNHWKSKVKNNQEYYDYLKPSHESQAKEMGIQGFRVGSSWIPHDMLAFLHQGERILTASQNKEFESIQGYSLGEKIFGAINNSLYPFNIFRALNPMSEVSAYLTKITEKSDLNGIQQLTQNNSIIQKSVQDIVIAIKTQTTDIINFLSTMSFNQSTNSFNRNLLTPSASNTKVI